MSDSQRRGNILTKAAQDWSMDNTVRMNTLLSSHQAHVESFEAGARWAFEQALAEMRGRDAEAKCVENTLGSGNFVSHSEWADWLESRLK